MIRRTKRELVLITGAHGFLGQHVAKLFLDESHCDIILTGREEKTIFTDAENEPRVAGYYQLDIADRNAVRNCIQSSKPNVIVNCAGFVDVDRAESERETAWRTNASSIEYFIESARKVDARIAHVSSDYIFDGMKTPYAEGATPHPLNYYGRTKLASENALRSSGVQHVIIRVAMLYGVEERSRKNFAMRVIDTLQQKQNFQAYTDLFAPPTLVNDAAFALVRAVELNKYGIFNLAGPDVISRYDFAQRIAKTFRLDEKLIEPVKYDDDANRHPADRPRKTAFVTLKAQTELSIRPTSVDDGLQVMYRELKDLSFPDQAIVYT